MVSLMPMVKFGDTKEKLLVIFLMSKILEMNLQSK